jgi:hypothetical protein
MLPEQGTPNNGVSAKGLDSRVARGAGVEIEAITQEEF